MMPDTLIPSERPIMFTLTSILSYLVTVVVFYFTARYINRAMAEKGIPSGMVRLILVCFLAAVVALFAGAGVDLIGDTLSPPEKNTK
jgi:predicted PurR-regulated permease PerM